MESTVKRGPWLEEEFTKEGESYIVNDGYVEGFRASITPREGFFDVEVYRNEYEYERDDEIGVHVEYHRETYLNSRELTVDNVRTAVRDFELAVPDNLANELTEWQEKYWDGNEIEQFAPDSEDVIRRDGYSVYMRDGVPAMYAVNIGLDSRVTIKPTQDGFEVQVTEDGVKHSKSLEESAKDVEKILDLVDISIPYKLVEELSEWRREFLESEAYADEMHMAAAEAGDLDGRLTPEEVEMAYGREAPEETSERLRLEFGSTLAETQGISSYETLGDAGSGKSRLIHSALAEAQGGANYESPKIAGEGDDEIANRPGYTMEEWERTLDREPDRRYEAGIDLMEAEGIRRAELELRREQNEQAKFPRLPFIEEALAAGANVDHLSVRHHGGDWTVVSFENAEGTYLVKGEDVYVTESSVLEAQAAIEADPIALPGIGDLKPAGDIEIEAPDVSFSQVIDSMGPNNRAILEKALADGAVVNRFWAERSEWNPERYTVAVVSFEDAPGAYIFWNGEDGAQKTQLDFGATRYALDFGYEISDLDPVSEIRSEENKVEPRGRSLDHSLSM